jgi:Ca-activated chloride channel homolog
MKLKKVALLSLGGMFLSSMLVYGVTEPEASAAPASDGVARALRAAISPEQLAPEALDRFDSDGTLRVEGRLGHATLATGSQRTFVALEVRGGDGVVATTRPEVHMSLVIDRSGSMKGGRLDQAIRAARGVVDRLADGDSVSVVSFDTQPRVEQARTVIDRDSRARVQDAIGKISLGGDTCVSCGIEEAIAQMVGTGQGMQRVIVLSDGDTNHGVRDIEGFRRIAQRCRRRGLAISTVGVGVDYNERLLSTVAFESNGLHHFVEDESSLARVFEAETKSVTTAVASDAVARLDLAPGVRLVRVFGRAFTRSATGVEVPLGTFAPGETKTVLAEVELTSGASDVNDVVEVAVRYEDHARGGVQSSSGKLAAKVGPVTASLDPFVAARLERVRTSAALEEANVLAKRGDLLAARSRVQQRLRALRRSHAQNAAPGDARGGDIDKSFRQQIDFAEDAVDAFGEASSPAAAPKAKKRAVRSNQSRATTMEL